MSNYYNRQWRLPNNENKDKQSNYSMDFDGSSYINIGTSDVLNFTPREDAFSVSVWVKKDGSGSFGRTIYSYNADSGPRQIQFTYDESSQTLYAIIGGSSSTASANLTDGNWHHVVFIIPAATTGVLFYHNGSLITTTSSSIGTSTGTVGGNIGSRTNGSFNFIGQIDGLSIFNYELSASQITTLYGSSSTGIGNPMSLSPAPVAYYPLGDQDSFNGSNYLVPNSSLKDYVFDFDTNDYISFGNNSVFQPSTNYTFSIWFKYNSSSSVGIFSTNSSVSSVGGVLAYINSTSILYYHASDVLLINNIPSSNEWINLTVTWSASTGIVRSFINGKYKAQLTGKTSMTWGNDLIVGKYKDSSMYFDGELSNFVMWNATLTDGFSGTPTAGDVAGGQVAEVYNNGSPQTTVTGTPVGWWKLDASATYDSSTTTWTIPDDSSNSNDGTSSGMTQANLVQSDLSFTSGYSPYALDFDGANDYIRFFPIDGVYKGGIVLPDNFTVSYWIKTNVNNNDAGPITGGGFNSDGIWSFFRYAFFNSGIQRLRINAVNTNVTTYLADDQWHNVIYTNSYDNTKLKVYTDNVLTYENTTHNFGRGNNIANIARGELGLYCQMQISNLSVWNTALTSAQVTEIYSEGVPQNLNNHSAYSNLVSWWQLGSNSSYTNKWIVLDEKGTNNGESLNMTEADIVDGVGSYANGLSSAMGGDEVVGNAPYSSSNSLSINMDIEDRTTDTPS